MGLISGDQRSRVTHKAKMIIAGGAMVVIILGFAEAASAVDLGDKVVLHGFGGWAYGKTDGNAYAVGNDEGSYDNADLTLNITATPAEKLTLVGQIQFLEDDQGEAVAELEYAFAEWAFSDSLKLRVGRVPHPFALYAEFFNVGTLRPFFLLPQSIYGQQGVIAEFYNGVGITGQHHNPGEFGIQYDLYVGQLKGEFRIPSLLAADPTLRLNGFVDSKFETRDMIGVKLDLLTPVDGFKIGVSAYTGEQTIASVLGGIVPTDVDTWGLHGEYLSGNWIVRSEFTHQERDGAFETNGGYGEAAFRFHEHWEVAGRVEDWDFDLLLPIPLPPVVRQTEEHQEVAIGLNRWFNANFVLKLSYHDVTGNRFAFPNNPADIERALLFNILDDSTELIVLGAHFSF